MSVRYDTERLTSVKKLWRTHSDTLGFFPEGAFQDHSSKGWVLAAESKDGEFLGYLLYRCVSRGGPWPIAVIVHLCVMDESRLNGISRALVDHLFVRADKSFLRVEVKCRKDYTADKIWPKLGLYLR